VHYVILHHLGIDRPHFDLMFEFAPGSALATWRLDQWPVVHSMKVERLGDHRREYLDYEGPLTGDRGYVRRVDLGECEVTTTGNQWTIRAAQFTLRLTEYPDKTWRCELV
jgi:hypothetical protein